MFGKSYFKELQELPEKSGGSFLIKKYPLFVKCVEASGEEELFDLDEEKDFVQLNEYLFKSFAD